VVGRLWLRHTGLPDWAPQLSERERGAIHHIERALYLAMFALPVSGFVFVMAGGYGVEFAGTWTVPDPISRSEWLARAAQLVHAAGGIVLVAALAAHLGLVLRHALVLRDGRLRRMLPGRD
jgi:cytochrome b561